MSLDPSSARSRSPSPAPHMHSHSHSYERRASTPGLRPSNAPSATPSPSASPAMLPTGLGINDMDVDWDPLPESHDHHKGHDRHDRYRLTGRKGYNALHTPPTRDASPARGHHHSHSDGHHHSHSQRDGSLAPPQAPEHLVPLPPSPAPSHHGGYGHRKGYNATPDHVPFSPVEVGEPSPLRPRDHSAGAFGGRKGYNSASRSLSPRSNP